jgi:arsenate reductase
METSMATTQPKGKTLFLCTGNSCRSQMAEALLRHHAGDRFEAFSAGLEPKPIHPLTHEVMKEKGIDTTAQRSKDVTEYLGRERFAYLIIVCDGAHRSCPTAFPGVQHRLFWPLDDPAAFEGSHEETLAKFRQVRDQIDARIQDWLNETA